MKRTLFIISFDCVLYVGKQVTGLKSSLPPLVVVIVIIIFRYIQENYSKIRDVERELANLSLEMKLTAGPKKAGFYKLLLAFLEPI